MTETYEQQVATLLESLPYIRQFWGKTVVIKYGGAAMSEPGLREQFAKDIVLLKYVGINPVIVHGGGPAITDYMKRLNLPVEFVQGMRVSDSETVEVAKMVLVGKVNKDIVLRLNRQGHAAIGLCGDDGELFEIRKQRIVVDGDEQDLGFVGTIENVSVDIINHVTEDYIPVIASVGAGVDGNSYNVNADEAAGAVAAALRAHKVIFLTDVEGWLADPADNGSLIKQCGIGDVLNAIADGQIAGGMLPKLKACAEALEGGVESAHIVDGRLPHSVLLELFTDAGIGTKISP